MDNVEVPRWKLVIFALPAIATLVTLMSMEASVIAQIQSAEDISSLFKVKFGTSHVNPTGVFKPAFERAGYNVSNLPGNDTSRYSTNLPEYYYLQGNTYTGCTYNYTEGKAICEDPIVMEHSVYLDFPRRFLFNVTHSIRDTTNNESIWLESPDDVVPLIPDGYLNEAFEMARARHLEAFVFGLVVSIIGFVVVIINVGLCMKEGVMDPFSFAMVSIALAVQGLFKVMAMVCWLEKVFQFISTSKAKWFLYNNSEWGLYFSDSWAFYEDTCEQSIPFLIIMFWIAFVGGSLSVFVLSIPLQISPDDFYDEWESKMEDKQYEKESKDLV